MTLRSINKSPIMPAVALGILATACVNSDHVLHSQGQAEPVRATASETKDFVIATINDHKPYSYFATPPQISLTCLPVPNQPFATTCHATEDPLAEDSAWVLRMSGLQWAVWTIELETNQPQPFPNANSAMFCQQIDRDKLIDCTSFAAPDKFDVYRDNRGI